MAATSFIRNELILGEKLCKEMNSRRAKEELFEIRDRMNQVLHEYDMSEEAYDKLSNNTRDAACSPASVDRHQTEILEHISKYKDACTERSSVLNALNFFFSSYCEGTQDTEDILSDSVDAKYSQLYQPDFGNDFDTAYISARSALERLKFLNSQIVSLATQILVKKRGYHGHHMTPGGEWMEGELGSPPVSKTCCRATLDTAQVEFERILEELEAKVALNSRLKKYVKNQEEAVEVCQSIARRLAVDNAHMVASLTSSQKDVRTLTREVERCVSLLDDIKEKYKIPPSECQITTDQDINKRNVKSYRDLKKYETHVREIELDFSRLEHLSKLLDTMKLQLHQANKRKELTEEQFRGRIAKLRSDVTEETKVSKLNFKIKEENGGVTKGKKRKKKKGKKSAKSLFSSSTTIGDGTDSIISEADSAMLSPRSNFSETAESRGGGGLLYRRENSEPTKKSSSSSSRNKNNNSTNGAGGGDAANLVPPDTSTTQLFVRSLSRQMEAETHNDDVITALLSHSSPTITSTDPLFTTSHRTHCSEAP